MLARALGLALGFAADRFFGDPTRHHPVAAFGSAAQHLEQHVYADNKGRGIAYTAALVVPVALAGVAADRLTRRHPVAGTLLVAVSTWAVVGGRSLSNEATLVNRWLEAGDLASARQQVTHLVGRDPRGLDEAEIVRATVESIAENTSDAVVAPLLAGSIGGIGGLLAYRATNTLDAMVGHRSARLVNFGWASARLDDLLNVIPSRVSAGLAALLAPLVGGRPLSAIAVWKRDARKHPSPNAGPVEASFAGALDVRLGGSNTYGKRIEHRATMGDGPPPMVRDIPRSVRLADAVGAGGVVVSVVIALRPKRMRRPAR